MKKKIVLFGICCALGCSACGKTEDSGAYEAGLKAMEQKDYATALAQFQEAADSDGRTAEAYRCEGIVYLEQQDYEHAVILLKKSLEELDFKNQAFEKDVNYYLGTAYADGGQVQEAIELYTKLINKHEDAEAYFLRGKLYLEQQEDQKASADFGKSLEKDDSYDNYIHVYLAYSEKNRRADGAVFLEQAADQSAEDAVSQYQQGKIYYYLEEYDRAKEVLNQSLNGGNQDAILLLGKIYLETNDSANARALYQSYLKEHADSAKAYNGLALCDIADGEYDSAIENIRCGLKDNDEGEQENLFFNEIVVYEDKLDFEAAKQKMAVFLEKYPDNEAAVRENVFLQSR